MRTSTGPRSVKQYQVIAGATGPDAARKIVHPDVGARDHPLARTPSHVGLTVGVAQGVRGTMNDPDDPRITRCGPVKRESNREGQATDATSANSASSHWLPVKGGVICSVSSPPPGGAA